MKNCLLLKALSKSCRQKHICHNRQANISHNRSRTTTTTKYRHKYEFVSIHWQNNCEKEEEKEKQSTEAEGSGGRQENLYFFSWQKTAAHLKIVQVTNGHICCTRWTTGNGNQKWQRRTLKSSGGGGIRAFAAVINGGKQTQQKRRKRRQNERGCTANYQFFNVKQRRKRGNERLDIEPQKNLCTLDGIYF